VSATVAVKLDFRDHAQNSAVYGIRPEGSVTEPSGRMPYTTE